MATCGLAALTASTAALAQQADFVVKVPAGTMTYKIVLAGHLDSASPAGAAVKKQFHDVVDIHRAVEVTTTLFQVPTRSSPRCGRACGDDWASRALQDVNNRIAKRCGNDYACRVKAIQTGGAEINRITILGNLQSLAAEGPTWSQMQPCTATMTVNDTETLTRYAYADEAGNADGKDPGLVTRTGHQTGAVKEVSCEQVLDTAYVIYLAVERDRHGYNVQLPPFSIPTAVTRGTGAPPETGGHAGVSGADLRDNTVRLGANMRTGDTPLPLPAPGRPYSGELHIAPLFKIEQTPVFHRSHVVPVSADVTWRFMPNSPRPAH